MNRNQGKYKKKRHQKTNHAYVWFFVIFFSALAGIALYTRYSQEALLVNFKDNTISKITAYFPHLFQKKPAAAHPKSKKRLSSVQEEKPIHFNFYDELPKMQLAFSEQAPEEEEEEEVATAAPVDRIVEEEVSQESVAKTKSIESTPYILQIAVFHKADAANRYQAALSSAGLKVDVVREGSGKNVVYRLQQGPYRNQDQLKAAKKRLTERGITCDIRKSTPYNT